MDFSDFNVTLPHLEIFPGEMNRCGCFIKSLVEPLPVVATYTVVAIWAISQSEMTIKELLVISIEEWTFLYVFPCRKMILKAVLW